MEGLCRYRVSQWLAPLLVCCLSKSYLCLVYTHHDWEHTCWLHTLAGQKTLRWPDSPGVCKTMKLCLTLTVWGARTGATLKSLIILHSGLSSTQMLGGKQVWQGRIFFLEKLGNLLGLKSDDWADQLDHCTSFVQQETCDSWIRVPVVEPTTHSQQRHSWGGYQGTVFTIFACINQLIKINNWGLFKLRKVYL